MPVCPYSRTFGSKERILAWFPPARLILFVLPLFILKTAEVGIALATPVEANCCFMDVSFVAASPGNSLGFGQNTHQLPSLGHRASVRRGMGMSGSSSGLAFIPLVPESSQHRLGQAEKWRGEGGAGVEGSTDRRNQPACP